MDEEFTPEELAALQSLENDNTPPPTDDEEGGSAPVAPADATPPAPDAAASTTPPADGADADAAKFEAFRAKHADKTPDELLRMFFQQESRANRMAFDARQAQDQRNQVIERARQALEDQKRQIQDRRKAFNDQLENDPDAATRALAEERFNAEERRAIAEAENAEREARIDEAYALAATAIPDLPTQMKDIFAFGQEMNYTPEELNGIVDGRDIVTLYLAKLSGTMIKAGLMDIRGNMVGTPPSVAATDPRLTAPAPIRTVGSAPARAPNATRSPEDALADILTLSDAEFAKLSIEQLMKLTEGAN